MPTMSARLDPWLKERIEEFWRSHGEGPSTGLRRIVEEWWAMEHLPEITFEDGVAGRRARLRSGPDVWEILSVREEYGDDEEGFREHFAFVRPEALRQALEYAERFPDGIRALIENNRRVERLVAGDG
ncbi:MAG: hypothetical protein R6U98_13805 [Pirellulaceae bacterium]